jgi:hypothetical protein
MDEDSKRYSALEIQVGNQLPTQLVTSTEQQCSTETATASSALLISCFADYGKVNPTAYAARLTDLFMDYPPDVVEMVVRDLPLEKKFFPSLAEVKEALDGIVYERQCEIIRQREYEGAQRRVAWLAKQVPEYDGPKPVKPDDRYETYEQREAIEVAAGRWKSKRGTPERRRDLEEWAKRRLAGG